MIKVDVVIERLKGIHAVALDKEEMRKAVPWT